MSKRSTPDSNMLTTKTLSFFDFDEDKKSLLRRPHQNLDFDASDGDETSEWQSVDEGAIAILSMDEIKNMKKM